MDDFSLAIAAAERDAGGRGIGTLGEKSLHLALKYYFAPDPADHERPIGGFVADAVTESGVVEIQTRGLGRLRPKLDAFLPLTPVTVVVPIRTEITLVRVNDDGEVLGMRRSPLHQTPLHAMPELYTLRDYLTHPGLTVCLVGVAVTEYRRPNKRREEKLDRAPTALTGLWNLTCPADYAALCPSGLPELVTAQQLAEYARVPVDCARMYLYLLGRLGAAEEAGRIGRSKAWRIEVRGAR